MLSTNDFQMSHSHFLSASQPLPSLPPPHPPPDGGNPLASHTFFSKETEFWISQVKTLKLPAYNRRLGCLNLSSIESGGWIKIGCPIIGHVRYFKIQAWLWGFWVKIANLSSFLCPSIPKRDLDTKKTTPNIEVWPESLGAMLCTYQRPSQGVDPGDIWGNSAGFADFCCQFLAWDGDIGPLLHSRGKIDGARPSGFVTLLPSWSGPRGLGI